MHPNLSKTDLFSSPNLCIKKSNIHRYGVFTNQNLEEGDLIEESPMLYLPYQETEEATIHSHCYAFSEEYSVIGFGHAALYNHTDDGGNINYYIDDYNECMVFYAIKTIHAGSELTLDYGVGDTTFEE